MSTQKSKKMLTDKQKIKKQKKEIAEITERCELYKKSFWVIVYTWFLILFFFAVYLVFQTYGG